MDPIKNSNDLQPDSAKLVETVPTPELSSSVEMEDERYLVDEEHFAVPLHPAPLHPRRQAWLARKPVEVGMTSKPYGSSDSCRDSSASTVAEHQLPQAR